MSTREVPLVTSICDNRTILAPSPKRKREPQHHHHPAHQEDDGNNDNILPHLSLGPSAHPRTVPFPSNADADTRSSVRDSSSSNPSVWQSPIRSPTRHARNNHRTTTNSKCSNTTMSSPVPKHAGAFQFTSFPASLPRVHPRREHYNFNSNNLMMRSKILLDDDHDHDASLDNQDTHTDPMCVHKRRHHNAHSHAVSLSRSMDEHENTMETTACTTSTWTSIGTGASCATNRIVSGNSATSPYLNPMSVSVDEFNTTDITTASSSSNVDTYHQHLLQSMRLQVPSPTKLSSNNGDHTNEAHLPKQRQPLFHQDKLQLTFDTHDADADTDADINQNDSYISSSSSSTLPPPTPTVNTRLNFNTLLSPTCTVEQQQQSQIHASSRQARHHRRNSSGSSMMEEMIGILDNYCQSPSSSKNGAGASNSAASAFRALQASHTSTSAGSADDGVSLQRISAQCSPIDKTNTSAILNTSSTSSTLSSPLHRHRPMPDMTAFDSSSATSHAKTSYLTRTPLRSRICPPTPVKTPESKSLQYKLYTYAGKSIAEYKGPYLGTCSAGNSGSGSFDCHQSLPLNGIADDCSTSSSTQESLREVSFKPLHTPHSQTLSHDSTIDSSTAHNFTNGYLNLGLIGSGSFADVYKCKSLLDDKIYAIKRNRRQCRGRRERARVLAEVRTLQVLNHMKRGVSLSDDTCHSEKYALSISDDSNQGVCPYLLKFFDAWQEDGYIYTQTELCSKHTCWQLLLSLTAEHSMAKRRYPCLQKLSEPVLCPEGTLWKICHDVASGLEYMHKHNLVHHDIKPANIFFSLDDGEVICKIGDFGMSGPTGHAAEGDEGDTTYMPLELLSSSTKHSSADLFSLGMTLYELASYSSWELPREGRRWHAIRDSQHILELPTERTDVFRKLIQRLIQPNAAMRPSARELLDYIPRDGLDSEFLMHYVTEVQEFEIQREKEVAAAHRAALEQRFTPTGPVLRGEKGHLWMNESFINNSISNENLSLGHPENKVIVEKKDGNDST